MAHFHTTILYFQAIKVLIFNALTLRDLYLNLYTRTFSSKYGFAI